MKFTFSYMVTTASLFFIVMKFVPIKKQPKRKPCMNDVVVCVSASGPIQPTEMQQNVQPDTDLHLPWLQRQPGCQEDENMPGFI